MDFDVGQYSDQHDRAGTDVAELAPRREVRHTISSTGPRFLRSVGRERRGGAAGTGSLWMVRHSGLDWGRSDQHFVGDACSGMEKRRSWPGNLFFHFLAN